MRPAKLTTLADDAPVTTTGRVRRALKKSETVPQAARQLGVSTETLYRVMRRLGLKSGKPRGRRVEA